MVELVGYPVGERPTLDQRSCQLLLGLRGKERKSVECWVVDDTDELGAGSLWIPKVGNWAGDPKDWGLEVCQLGKPTVEAGSLVVGAENLDPLRIGSADDWEL